MEAAVAPTTESQRSPRIADLRPGQRFEGRFGCLRKDRLTSRNGGSYLSRRAPRPDRDALRAGCSARPTGSGCASRAATRSAYAGESSASAASWSPSSTTSQRLEPGTYDPAEFLPAAYRSVEELEGFLEHLAREIHDPALLRPVERLLLGGPVAADFRRAPCTRAGHHAYLGGLLEHTVSVGTLVGDLCQLHPRLDSDLLMAAALLHDVGKAREFTYGARFELSDEGRMLGHLAIGAQLIAGAAEDVPAERRLPLLNCVLSHHGPDGGRPGRGFDSPEALALYRLNALDASVKGALEHGL